MQRDRIKASAFGQARGTIPLVVAFSCVNVPSMVQCKAKTAELVMDCKCDRKEWHALHAIYGCETEFSKFPSTSTVIIYRF